MAVLLNIPTRLSPINFSIKTGEELPVASAKVTDIQFNESNHGKVI
jgi:hypothetical protein